MSLEEELEELQSEYDSLNHAFRLAGEKLDAIETHFTKRPKSMINPPLRDPLASIGYDDKKVYEWIQSFKKILGVESG